jgi:hypothetical protein
VRKCACVLIDTGPCEHNHVTVTWHAATGAHTMRQSTGVKRTVLTLRAATFHFRLARPVHIDLRARSTITFTLVPVRSRSRSLNSVISRHGAFQTFGSPRFAENALNDDRGGSVLLFNQLIQFAISALESYQSPHSKTRDCDRNVRLIKTTSSV